MPLKSDLPEGLEVVEQPHRTRITLSRRRGGVVFSVALGAALALGVGALWTENLLLPLVMLAASPVFVDLVRSNVTFDARRLQIRRHVWLFDLPLRDAAVAYEDIAGTEVLAGRLGTSTLRITRHDGTFVDIPDGRRSDLEALERMVAERRREVAAAAPELRVPPALAAIRQRES